MRRLPFLAAFAFVFSAINCMAQDQDALCNAGNGLFEAQFQDSEIWARVGASRNGELATRSCDAVLTWHKHVVSVAKDASQVDVDAFGADLGFKMPVAAFQVKKSNADCCREYRIYSLKKPPRLLTTLTGGSSFRSADIGLDGRIEIWTDDAGAVGGFEGLSPGELEAPTIVLRFSGGQLLDASAEFQSYFDDEIAKRQKELSQDEVREFQNSDGQLSTTSFSAERMHKLRRAKGQILGIVWTYLYSGREQQAWNELAQMWPSRDLARIRGKIISAREHGILAEANGKAADLGRRKKRVTIFDAVGRLEGGKPEVDPPRAILLVRPLPTGGGNAKLMGSESILDMVVDSAGKVRSVEPLGKSSVDAALIEAAKAWKFIPAFKAGKAVACRMRMSVSPRQ